MNNINNNDYCKSFFSDEEKMIDFATLSKEDFLKSYSYLTEEEYNATAIENAYKNGVKDGMCLYNKWIPCTEHLPTDECYNNQYDWVLVATKMVPEGYYGVPHIAEYRSGIWRFQDCDYRVDDPATYGCITDEEYLSIEVTHWMPITPEYPE